MNLRTMKLINLLLLFLIPISGAFAQHTITGKVTDHQGKPILGASITVRGAQQRTQSDETGAYSIANVKSSDILVYSYIGFQTVEKLALDQQTINVQLKIDEVQLNEVVVVGYDVVKKGDLTGSVASVNPDELKETATANFDEALAGRVAGVEVTSSDGTPGGALNIVIRGGNSITGDNTPLYVVDGVPLEEFNPGSLNTRDIKSLDILKDASATAIYGSRGANGVVVITTNSGRSDGKTDIKASTSYWTRYIPTRLEVMGAYEYVKYQEKVAYARDNYVPAYNVDQFHNRWIDAELYRNTQGTNWQDEMFQIGLTNNHTVTLSTGNNKTTLYYSGNFLDQQGTLLTTGYRKINNRLKFTHKLVDNFEIKGQVEYSKLKYDGMQVSGDRWTSVIRNAVTFRPVQPVNWIEDEEETLITDDPSLFDPVTTLNNTMRQQHSDILAGTLGFNYEFLSKFNLDVTGNYRTAITESTRFYKKDTNEGSRTNRGINGIISDRRNNILSVTGTVRYKDKKGNHDYGFLVGSEAQHNGFETSELRNTNLPTDFFGINNLGIATTATIAQSMYTENTLLSYFGRANYAYDGKYLATVNFRADGSSKFRGKNTWGYFPSFSLAWRVSQEQFLKSVEAITDMKFRAGWGVTGNNRIGNFLGYNLFSVDASSGYVLGENQAFSPGAYQSNLAVPDLRWETTAQTNIGLDLQILKRFDFTMDYYIKDTRDLLLNAEMALSTGFSKAQQNIGAVSNRGFEFTLKSQNIRSRDFRWNTNFNISFNRTKTVQLNSGQQEIKTDPSWDSQFMQTEYQYITRIGQPVGMMYGLVFDGLYQLGDFEFVDGDYILKADQPSYQTAMRPGMVKFKDINEDGRINELDRTIIGNPHPKHTGGLFNHFRYKSFDLQFLLQWAYDFDILNGNKSSFGNIYIAGRNGLKSLNDIWTPENTDTEIGGIRYEGVGLVTPYGYKLDTRHIDDGSYLKLKTLALGYNLPQSILTKLRMKRCRVSVSAQNLYTWTKYEGYDPDVSVGRYGALTPRLDYSAYPQSVTVSGGIDITF